jgi:hypothetical protein
LVVTLPITDRDDSRNRDGVRAAIFAGSTSAFPAAIIPLKRRKKHEPEGGRKQAGNRLAIFVRRSARDAHEEATPGTASAARIHAATGEE